LEQANIDLTATLDTLKGEHETLKYTFATTRDSLTSERQELRLENHVLKNDLDNQRRKFEELQKVHRAIQAKLQEFENSAKPVPELRKQIDGLNRQSAAPSQKFATEIDAMNRLDRARNHQMSELQTEVASLKSQLSGQDGELSHLKIKNSEL
jgi:chromosome segregation ATPase